MSRVVFSILFLLSTMASIAQQKITFREADSLTYTLYLENRWNELITKGREAIDEGHDYFYMRMRMGIAYYNIQNYGLAAIHFRKALEFNEMDQSALEFLFYSYYLGGRSLQAWAVLSEMSQQNRDRILSESSYRKNSISLESFYSNAGTEEIIADPELYFRNPEKGSQIVTKSFINNQLSFSHMTGEKGNFFHSLTNLVKDNYLHYYDGTMEADLTSQKVVQFQYYAKLTTTSVSGWSFSPFIHLLTASYPYISIYNVGTNYYASTYRVRSGGFAGGFGVARRGGFMTLSMEALYSSFNSSGNLQGGLSLIIYPAGNQSVYFGGALTGISETSASQPETGYVKGFIAGFAINNRIWFEFSGSKGNMKNFTENNACYIYNGEDYLTGKYIGRIIIPLYKARMTFYAGMGAAFYTSEFVPADGTNNYGTNTLNYRNSTITGGISWNF